MTAVVIALHETGKVRREGYGDAPFPTRLQGLGHVL